MDKEPLKKAKTPKGRFDSPEDKSKDVLESEDNATLDNFYSLDTNCTHIL